MDITRYRGDTYADKIIVNNDTTGEPANLTGSTVYLTVNTVANPTDTSTQVYQLTGVIDADPTTGIVEFAPNVSQANQVGFFYFDIQVVDASGKIRTVNKGNYIYKQDITKV